MFKVTGPLAVDLVSAAAEYRRTMESNPGDIVGSNPAAARDALDFADTMVSVVLDSK